MQVGSLRMVNSTFIWEISDFLNKCPKTEEWILSPVFAAAGDIALNDIKWCLNLQPFGATGYEGFVSLFLRATFSSNITEMKISYALYLDNSSQENGVVLITHNFKNNGSFGFPQFLKRNGDVLKNHLSLSNDSTLRIACYITSAGSYTDSNFWKDQNKGYLNTFFLSENLSDVTIEVDNKKLNAHQIILSSKSQVFLAMFKHDTTERNERIIKITDVSYNVMKEVLRFIYCDEIEDLDSLSEDLLVAADKYDLFLLKRICEETLMKNLNVSNACKILSIFNLYQCAASKKKTIDFIIKHMKEVVDTEGFNKIKDHKLLADILRQNALEN